MSGREVGGGAVGETIKIVPFELGQGGLTGPTDSRSNLKKNRPALSTSGPCRQNAQAVLIRLEDATLELMPRHRDYDSLMG
jgi:hypothetical protein